MIEREYTDYGLTAYPINGVQYPSVSTVLSRIHSFGLERMKLRETIELARLNTDWEPDKAIAIAAKEAGPAARHGHAVHSVIEKFILNGTQVKLPGNELENFRLMIEGMGLLITDCEPLLCHPELGYAGRTDAIAEHPADGCVAVDWKTGGMYLEYVLQLAAYSRATHIVDQDDKLVLRDRMPNPKYAYIVSLDKKKPDAPAVYRVDLDGAFEVFCGLLKFVQYEQPRRLAAGRPWKDATPVNPATPEELKAAQAALEDAFGGDVYTDVDAYHRATWGFLRDVVKTFSDAQKKHLGKLWPVGVPVFKKVAAGEAAMPDLEQIVLVEQAICAVEAATGGDFTNVMLRPLAPAGCGLDVVPPIFYRVDSPASWDVALMHAEWAKLPAPKKKHFTGPMAQRRPRALTRAELAQASAEIQYIAANNKAYTEALKKQSLAASVAPYSNPLNGQ